MRLGLCDEAQYQTWCREHGLSAGINKSEAQRRKEVDLSRRVASEAAMSSARTQTRRPEDAIQAMYAGTVDERALRRPFLEKIASCFERLETADTRAAYRNILLHAAHRADLFGVKPAVAQLGAAEGNTFVEGLWELARWHECWIRPVDAWQPDSHNSRRQFGSLLRHLLCRYDVPVFMDCAWLQGPRASAREHQRWFVHVGTGGNIRKADIPVALTKKMAHLFLEAPASYTIEEALRWGQILGLGGEEPLLRAVNGTFLAERFDQEDFWCKVIHFFVNNPMLDLDQVGPIVDYIQNQKFEPREVTEPGGEIRTEPPPQPNFSVKGRSADKLVRQVDAWHRQLARETRQPDKTWAPCGIASLVHKEAGPAGEPVTWAIGELLTTKGLLEEGRAMHHCVGSYAGNCKKGNVSVWSMQVTFPEKRPKRVMTIAVQNRSRRINQARGKYNALPSGKTPNGRHRAFNGDYRDYLKESRRILRLWRESEGLVMGSRT